MVRHEAQRLDDIRQAIDDIEAFVAGSDATTFITDRKTQSAVAAALTVIGEAVKALPLDLRRRQPAVDWARWAGLRDVLVHQYARIEHQRIWRIVERDLPGLKGAVEAELRKLGLRS